MALRFAASRLLPAARLPAYRPSRALSAATPPKQTYTERQDKLGRPMSPHVTTYAFPIVAFSSVTVRITGMLLSVGVGGVSARRRRGEFDFRVAVGRQGRLGAAAAATWIDRGGGAAAAGRGGAGRPGAAALRVRAWRAMGASLGATPRPRPG